jgi:hypothetical protein
MAHLAQPLDNISVFGGGPEVVINKSARKSLHDDSDEEKNGINGVYEKADGQVDDPTPELLSEDVDDPDKIIKTGADAAQYMLSDRDDGDPAVTVRSMVLGTAFAAFYASISQIYMVSCNMFELTRSSNPQPQPYRGPSYA